MNSIIPVRLQHVQKAHLLFSKQVERKITHSENKPHARSILWVEKLTREFLGGVA